MNKCELKDIPCPFALTPSWSELPCFATQKQCDRWVGKHREIKTDKEEIEDDSTWKWMEVPDVG